MHNVCEYVHYVIKNLLFCNFCKIYDLYTIICEIDYIMLHFCKISLKSMNYLKYQH